MRWLEIDLERLETLSQITIDELEKVMVKLYQLKLTDLYSLRSKWDPEGYKISQGKQKIPDRTRWAVWRRDNFTCVYCDSYGDLLTLDHVIPEELGGEMTETNLVTACGKCNNRKANMSREDFEATEWLAKKKKHVQSLNQKV